MARMSIDDKFLRDPRVKQLALDLKMSKWEARGRLLEVFSVCYDLERDVLTCNQVDLAAESPGFGDAMFAVDLAVNVRGGMRIRGAGERIKYLGVKSEAGRIGGLKSGESRRKAAKQKRSNPEASANPPDPVPDPAPDPVPEDQSSPPACAIPPDQAPVAPAPTVAPTPEMDKSVHSPSSAPTQADADRESRRRVQLEIRAELELARRDLAAELDMADHGLLAQDPGERELAAHLVAAGPTGLAAARGQAIHAIAMAKLEARRDRSLRWLTGAIFAERNFRRLVAMTAEEARRATPIAKGAQQPAPARPRKKPTDPPLQVSTLTPEERIALAAEARATLGLADGARAPPSSTAITDEQQPQPARKPA